MTGVCSELALPFTHLADELGDARAAYMIMLGSLAETVRNLPEACIDVALLGL